MIELWPEQADVIEQVRQAIRDGYRSILVVAPTGSGKTVIGASIIHSAEEKQNQSIFLAHRRELIYQTADKLNRFGVTHGIIMAGEKTDHWKGVDQGNYFRTQYGPQTVEDGFLTVRQLTTYAAVTGFATLSPLTNRTPRRCESIGRKGSGTNFDVWP